MNTRDFIRQFLGSDEQGTEEAHSSLRRMKDVTPHHQHLLLVALIIFRYRLLDIFADALDVPRHPKFCVVPRSGKPEHSVSRLDRVCNFQLTAYYYSLTMFTKVFENLRHWPNVILYFIKIYEKNQAHALPNSGLPMEVESSTSEHRVFHAGLQSLRRAQRYKCATLYNKVMYNIEVLVFCLWWFGAVRSVIIAFCTINEWKQFLRDSLTFRLIKRI